MPYTLKDAEFTALLSENDLRKRYGYCVKKIADFAALYWLASAKGRCVIGPDEAGQTPLPVWPHARFAQAYVETDPVAQASWPDARPIEIDVYEFLDKDMPQLIKEGFAIAAFPVAPGRAILVAALEFEANLRYELSRIECPPDPRRVPPNVPVPRWTVP